MKRESLSLAALLLVFNAYGSDPEPADSLKIARDVALDEVTVSATRATGEMPVAFSELSGKELNSRNDGQGIPYLISLTPSVTMTSDDGTGIGYSGFRIRGTDANRINVTVNGVPVNDSESHSVFWVNMPDFASSVDNIQIQRGAGTSTNGAAAFGATVAMQTQKPELKPYAEYQLSAGSFGTVKNMVKGGTGLLHGHFVIDARYSHVRSDGFVRRASADMSSYFLSAAYYGDNSLIRFQTFGSNEKTYQAWTGVPSSMLNGDRRYNPCGEYEDGDVVKYYDNQTDNYRQQHYHLILTQRLGDYWNANATLHYTPGEGYYEDYREDDDFGNGETDLVRRKWLKGDFYGGIFGLNYLRENLHATLGGGINRYVCDHFGRIIWAKASDLLPEPDYEYYRNTGDKLDYNLYVKANYRITSAFNAFLDLQYRGIDYTIDGSDDKAGDNLHVDKRWNFFNPKAGLNFRRGGHSAFASFAVANREPNRDNFTEAGIGERPTHETLYDYEAGYDFTHPRFRLGVNLYYMDYVNQLILTGKISEIGEALTSNIKNSYRMGVELSGGVKITDRLSWSANATLSRNRIKNFTEVIENYDASWAPVPGKEVIENRLGDTDIAFSPEIIANSIFDLNLKGFSASFTSRYVGRQYMDNTSARSRS
ncbi:MAG: TonB-dependent receptor plug domain-containing protein, partial [Tannerellaceae bacterium]|nr:TonB-dependent receptor plug domain-containing protein [Tannerellaceae bacterium]